MHHLHVSTTKSTTSNTQTHNTACMACSTAWAAHTRCSSQGSVRHGTCFLTDSNQPPPHIQGPKPMLTKLPGYLPLARSLRNCWRFAGCPQQHCQCQQQKRLLVQRLLLPSAPGPAQLALTLSCRLTACAAACQAARHQQHLRHPVRPRTAPAANAAVSCKHCHPAAAACYHGDMAVALLLLLLPRVPAGPCCSKCCQTRCPLVQ
ncbi:hypothetical protein COO60DRAFT_1480510 [Scenedesmus sp. NREL 46B-D3]|nr:hypothetical protein COO60DRAFT_1480510 [Scenedesmus sp. NREL 46B-D3]